MNQEISSLIPRLPTPLARAVLRMLKSSNDHERVDTFIALTEVWIKFSVTVVIARLRLASEDFAYSLEYEIAHSGALGKWFSELERAAAFVKDTGSSPPELTVWREWWNGKPSALCVAEITAVNSCIAPNGAPLKIKKNRDVVEWFVWLRNKVKGHGNPTSSQALEIGSHVRAIVDIALSSPLLSSAKLIHRIPSTFSPCFRDLVGATPSSILDLDFIPDIAKLQKERDVFFLFPASNSLSAVSPFLDYRDDDYGCFWLNSGIKSRGAEDYADFVDPFTNIPKTRLVAGLRNPPPHRPKAFVSLAPAVSDNDPFSVVGCQAIIADSDLGLGLGDIEWHRVPFDRSSADLLPSSSQAGVYIMIAFRKFANLTDIGVVGYVGETDDLARRFSEYLNERKSESGRTAVRLFLSSFSRLFFCFAYVPAIADRKGLEALLIRYLDPVANTTLRRKICRLEGLLVSFSDQQPVWDTTGGQNADHTRP